jgi:hypothetical protein
MRRSSAQALRRYLLVGGILLIGIGGSVLHFLWPTITANRETAVADAKAWTIQGPPCPSLTRDAFQAQNLKPRRSFDYREVKLARAYGHVECRQIKNGGGQGLGSHTVCQFTSPAVLQVTTSKGDFFFLPGIGKPATVSIEQGVARCVLAGDYRV